MGEVVLARRLSDERTVAIKWVASSDGSGSGRWTDRLEREARLLETIDHERIVHVFECGVFEGRAWLAMEFVQGGSLRERLDQGGALEIEEARRIVAQIAEGVTALHERGILHRDLKPENVLLDESGDVKIVDFGLAVSEQEIGNLTMSGQVLGTADYLAPEQKYRLPLDARCDQYSLAVVAYELITGRKPLGSFQAPSERNKSLDSGIDAVLHRALREDPEDRYPDVRGFALAFDDALRRRRRRWKLPAALVVAGVLACAVLVWRPWSVGGPEPTPFADGMSGPPRTADPSAPDAENVVHGGAPPRALGRPKGVDPEKYDDYAREMQLALANGERERWQESLEHCDAALVLWPESVEANFNRGCALAALGRDAEAELAYDAALALDPEHVPSLTNRAHVRAAQDELELALADLTAAVELEPDVPLHRFNRIALGKRLGRIDLLIEDQGRVVELLPDDLVAAEDLAWTLASSSLPEYADAERAIRIASDVDTRRGGTAWRPVMIVAVAAAQSGDVERGDREARRALALAPEDRRASLTSMLHLFLPDFEP